MVGSELGKKNNKGNDNRVGLNSQFIHRCVFRASFEDVYLAIWYEKKEILLTVNMRE